jgi:hypothetical protein
LASQIARSLVGFQQNSFFQEGGEDHGRVLSNPKELTNLHTHQEITMEKEEVMARMAEENIRSCPGEMEGKSGGYPERRKIESIFEKVVVSRHRFFSKKRSDYQIIWTEIEKRTIGEKIFSLRNSMATRRKKK